MRKYHQRKFFVRNLGECYELITENGNRVPFIFLEEDIDPFVDNPSLLELQIKALEPGIKNFLRKRDINYLLDCFREAKKNKECFLAGESYFES